MSRICTLSHCSELVSILQADQICYAVLCVFSYVAAGQNRTVPNKQASGGKQNVAGNHLPASGGVSPRGPIFSAEKSRGVSSSKKSNG